MNAIYGQEQAFQPEPILLEIAMRRELWRNLILAAELLRQLA